MTRNDLYGAAFRYKKAGLWKKLWDSQIFAIKLSSGELGYLSVMGQAGEYCALGLYIGTEGFKSYRCMEKPLDDNVSPFVSHEHYLQQDCLQLALTTRDELNPEEVEETRAFAQANGIKLTGRNTFPQFIKYKPNYHPWDVTDPADIDALCEAAEAAILMAAFLKTKSPEAIGLVEIQPETTEVPLFVVKGGVLVQDGFAPIPPAEPTRYEKITVSNDIAVAKVKRLPKNGIWEAELVRMVEPLQVSPGAVPYYPMCLLVAESQSGYLLPADPIIDYEEYPEHTLDGLVDGLVELGSVPMEMKCRDDRTFALLEDFCSRTGIKLTLAAETLSALEISEGYLFDCMTDPSTKDDIEALSEVVDLLLSMPEEAIQELPKSLLRELRSAVESEDGMLPETLVRDLRDRLGKL